MRINDLRTNLEYSSAPNLSTFVLVPLTTTIMRRRFSYYGETKYRNRINSTLDIQLPNIGARYQNNLIYNSKTTTQKSLRNEL